MHRSTTLRDHYLLNAASRAAGRIARLASAYVAAPAEQKEILLAEIEFERWYLDASRDGIRRDAR